MRGEFEKQIGDVHFRVYQLGFKDSRRLLIKLLKTLAPPLATLLDGTPSLAALGSAIPANALDKCVEMLAASLSDEELDEMTRTLTKGARYSFDGQKWPVLDSAGQENVFGGGKIMRYLNFLRFALECNYADFLGELKGAASAVALDTPTSRSSQSVTQNSE